MLCSVVFRQFPQTEDVAKLVFWMVTLLVLGLRLRGQRKRGLIARLVNRLIVVLMLGC